MAVMLTSPLSPLPRVLARPAVTLVPFAVPMVPAEAAASTFIGVRVVRPWTQTIATIDVVLTRARRLTEHAYASGTQWEADHVLAKVLGAPTDTPSVVLGGRYEQMLGRMTYAERDQLLDAVRVCARVPEEFRPFMERVRGLQRLDGSWPIMDERAFQSAALDDETVDENLLSKRFYRLWDKLPKPWATELQAVYRCCANRGVAVNCAEAELAYAEFLHHRRWVFPYQVMQRILGLSSQLVEQRGYHWLHGCFCEHLAVCDPQVRLRINAIVDACTGRAIDLNMDRLRALIAAPPATPIDTIDFYRRVLGLPEDLPPRSVKERMLGALRRSSVLTIVAYRQAHLLWVRCMNDEYCARARKAIKQVEASGTRIAHDAFKRIVFDAPASMEHEEMLRRYWAFSIQVFTVEEKEVLDAAHLACTGYVDGRCGKGRHAEFAQSAAVRAAWAEQLADAVQSGAADPMDGHAYEAALMAQGRARRARKATKGYKSFVSCLDPALRAQFRVWKNMICRPRSVTVERQYVDRAMLCALEIDERVTRGGAYMPVEEFQRRAVTGSEAWKVHGAYYRVRDALDAPEQGLLDACMLAATRRPPHHVGRHPPASARVSIAGVAQRGIEYARALCGAGTTASPTSFYQRLFGEAIDAAMLPRLFALVQRQAFPADQALLDAAFGLATDTLWINGNAVPVASLYPRGLNGARSWWIIGAVTEQPVTSVVPDYLDAVMANLHELRATE